MSQRTVQRSAVAAATVLGVALLIDTRIWAWPLWRATWSAAGEHLLLTAVGVPAVAVLAAATVLLPRHRRMQQLQDDLLNRDPKVARLYDAWMRRPLQEDDVLSRAPTGRRWHWLLSYPGVSTIAAAVALIGMAAFLMMLQIAADTTAADRTCTSAAGG